MRIPVAVGVIFNAQDQVLVAKRQDSSLGECWEFPGGKMEKGETPAIALKRELLEEVGIEITHYHAWLTIEHDYHHKLVKLYVHKVTAFNGQAQGCEGQEIQWVEPSQLLKLGVPHANEKIVAALLADPSSNHTRSQLKGDVLSR